MFHLITRLLPHILMDHVGARTAVHDHTLLPPRCAVCNRPVSAAPRRKAFVCTGLGSNWERITVFLYLCNRHAWRRLLVIGVSGAIVAVAGLIEYLSTRKEGTPPNSFEIANFIVMAIGSLFFINCLISDPFFRGLHMSRDGMLVKGFGKRFRESLKKDVIRVIFDAEFNVIKRNANQVQD